MTSTVISDGCVMPPTWSGLQSWASPGKHVKPMMQKQKRTGPKMMNI